MTANYKWTPGISISVNFIVGRWMSRGMVNTTMLKMQQVASNQWSVIVDSDAFIKIVQSIVTSKTLASVFQTKLSCQSRKMLQSLNDLGCLCGTNQVPNCLNEIKNRPCSPVGQKTALLSQVSSIGDSSVQLTISNGSFTNTSVPAVFSLCSSSTGPASNGVSVNVTKRDLSSLASQIMDLRKRAGSSSTAPAACFAVVQNANNAFVGQLLGDCAVVSSSVSLQSVGVCLTMKSSIPQDLTTYPMYAVAIKTLNSLTNVATYAVAPNNATVVGQQLCVSVSSAGTYCPGFYFMSIYSCY